MATDLEFPAILRGRKILLAADSFGNVNGVSRTTGSLVAYLRDNGVNVAVVAPSSPSHPTSKLSDFTALEVRLPGYPLPMNPELKVVYPFRIDRLFLRTFPSGPDLIYLASPASLGFQILLQIRRLAGVPPILCNFQTDLSGYCEIMFPWPFSLWAVWVFRSVQGYLFSHSSVRTVFYPSLFVRRYLEAAGVSSTKLMNLRRGVNTELFNPSMRDEDWRKFVLAKDGELILVSVSRLAQEKGFPFLSQVAHVLAEKDFPFHLVIVGGNRNPVEEANVRAMFSDISSRVTFTGFLEGAALARAYASADVKIHSSITETFGLVVLEAMASGLPVVARDEGGPSEIVAHNESGYLVAPSDIDKFVKCIEQLGADKGLREKMGRRARQLALEATWEKINNRVAWQLADILAATQSQSSEPIDRSPPPTIASSASSSDGTSQSVKIKPSKISLSVRRPLLSSGIIGTMTSFAISAQITACVGIIVGVWLGLIITWGLVQCALTMRAQLPWLLSGLRQWRNERLRERKGKGHATRRI
ncbi:MAG: hypothetical protein M1818_002401 [Claussenomyces sp. TS43310]|nr:MAG: hypothetical protein M1818_002401 [Claussenomyces sp. TS43310]